MWNRLVAYARLHTRHAEDDSPFYRVFKTHSNDAKSISKGLSKSVLYLRLFAKSQNKMQNLKKCLFQGPLQN